MAEKDKEKQNNVVKEDNEVKEDNVIIKDNEEEKKIAKKKAKKGKKQPKNEVKKVWVVVNTDIRLDGKKYKEGEVVSEEIAKKIKKYVVLTEQKGGEK